MSESMRPIHFEGRDLKSYAEPVSSSELTEGAIYFAVHFVDDDMLIPTLEPRVFVGRNLEPDDKQRVYFQDADSYRRGIRYAAASDQDQATFEVGSENEVSHLFEYERALDVLLHCALRRKSILGPEA